MKEKQNFVESCGFKVDENKNLYKKIGDTCVLIHKLKKDIFKMVTFENLVFFINTFGDCFVIEETESSKEPKFLFGILSQPIHFNVLNDRIYAVDRYSRVWVYDLEGEILNISFIKENIITVTIKNEYCAVTTDNQPVEIIYKKEQDNLENQPEEIIHKKEQGNLENEPIEKQPVEIIHKKEQDNLENQPEEIIYNNPTIENQPVKNPIEKKLMIFDRSFEIIRSQRIDKVLKYEDSHVSISIDGKEHDFQLNDHQSRKSLKQEQLVN